MLHVPFRKMQAYQCTWRLQVWLDHRKLNTNCLCARSLVGLGSMYCGQFIETVSRIDHLLPAAYTSFAESAFGRRVDMLHAQPLTQLIASSELTRVQVKCSLVNLLFTKLSRLHNAVCCRWFLLREIRQVRPYSYRRYRGLIDPVVIQGLSTCIGRCIFQQALTFGRKSCVLAALEG